MLVEQRDISATSDGEHGDDVEPVDGFPKDGVIEEPEDEGGEDACSDGTEQ